MAGTTTNLGLYYKDPLTDGNDTFNIQTMLNENWDKLDAAIGDVKTPASKMGLTGDLSVGAALNVLANIGNVHVWQRVQTYADPVPEVPAGYTLGAVEENVSITNTTSSTDTILMYSATSLTVSNDGTISTSGFGSASGKITSVIDQMYGKFIYFRAQDSDFDSNNIIFIPSDATRSWGDNGEVVVSKLQRVTGYPYTPAIPAGTHVDYLTSTDPNAYPKQSAEGGQDASYVLGDVVSGSFYIGSFFAGSNSAVQYMVSDTPFVDESGSVGISNGTTVTFSNSLGAPGTESDAIAKVKALFAGKYVMRTNNPETDSSTMYYTLLPKNEVVYIPDDISVSVLTTITGSPNSMALSKYQPVTGYPAIPANTVITYLGQLGDKARIEVGSYVGTGTYGASNKNTLIFGFEPKLVILENATGYSGMMLNGIDYARIQYLAHTHSAFVLSWSGNTLSWYCTKAYYANGAGAESTTSTTNVSAAYQYNQSGATYRYVAIG